MQCISGHDFETVENQYDIYMELFKILCFNPDVIRSDDIHDEETIIEAISKDEELISKFRLKLKFVSATSSFIMADQLQTEATYVDLRGKYINLPEFGVIQVLDSKEIIMTPDTLEISRIFKYVMFDETSSFIMLVNVGKFIPYMNIGGYTFSFCTGLVKEDEKNINKIRIKIKKKSFFYQILISEKSCTRFP